MPALSGPGQGRERGEVHQPQLPARSAVHRPTRLRKQLNEWNGEIADLRNHGTTYGRPIDRFEREQPQLVPTQGQTTFRLQARVSRVVASDYFVACDSNRYSVPLQLIGQTVELLPRDNRIEVRHRGQAVTSHTVSDSRHQLIMLPEHCPGAIARNSRRLFALPRHAHQQAAASLEVEVRVLAIYD